MGAGAFEHGAEARAALHAIVSDPAHGPGALDSRQVAANLLQDLLPGAPREAGLLIAAIDAGLPGLLRGHRAQGMDARTVIGLAAAWLTERTAFTAEACGWAATELALALGLAGADDVDVLVVGEPDRDAAYDAARRAEHRLGREVNVTIRGAGQWRSGTDGFTRQLRPSPLLRIPQHARGRKHDPGGGDGA